MNKKYFLLVIPLIALIAIGIFSGNGYSLGHFAAQSGIGGTIENCNKCHDFVNGIYGGGDPYGMPTPPPPPPPGYNLRWLKTEITFCSTSNNIACDTDTDCPSGETCGPLSRTVNFTTFEGAVGALADAGSTDGACQVCHTTTTYWRNDGSGNDHYPGQNCTVCHPHFTDELPDYFTPTFVGGQSHFTHFDDPKGPMLGSDACFTACHLSSANFKTFKDNKPIETTNVCDACHSPNGSFNGVGDMDSGNPNSVAYGAKYNWEGGIYEPAVDPEPWPSRLKAGKENWCAGCHDNGSSVIPEPPAPNGVSAPNVMGNNVTYGYNVTGHGRDPLAYTRCGDCHDLAAVHTDGNARTYSASLNNYQSGYRLKTEMAIPRYLQFGASAFRLCADCHIYTDVVGPASEFRQGDKSLHEIHLGQGLSGSIAWDSDWGIPASATCSEDECGDSAISCTACHNVHGSPCLIGSSIVACDTPLKTPMIRHGELISTPGSQDKVPALKYNWYNATDNPTTDFESSGGGGLLCCNQYPYNIPFNHVCWGCHQVCGEVKYYRLVTVKNVWTTDTSNTPKTTFHPGDSIRYHVTFTVSGQNPPYYIQAQGVAQKSDGTGPQQTFLKSQTLPLNNYEWTEDKLIPSSVTLPPAGVTVRITITVGSRGYYLGPLLAHDAKEALFFVLP
jgi:hypothetical protein